MDDTNFHKFMSEKIPAIEANERKIPDPFFVHQSPACADLSENTPIDTPQLWPHFRYVMRKNMAKWLRSVSAGLLFGSGIILFTGCTGVAYTAGPGGYYDYDYYPGWNIYYYPQGHVYYWNDGRYWRSGRRLPPRYNLHHSHWEHLHLHSRQPWTEHPSGHNNFQHGNGRH